MNILLEYLIVFVGVYVVNILLDRFSMNNLGMDMLKPQLVYIKRIYKITIKKDERKTFKKQVMLINAFIITTIYIILMYLIKAWWLKIILGIVLMFLLVIICYGLLGRYYRKKEGM